MPKQVLQVFIEACHKLTCVWARVIDVAYKGGVAFGLAIKINAVIVVKLNEVRLIVCAASEICAGDRCATSVGKSGDKGIYYTSENELI